MFTWLSQYSDWPRGQSPVRARDIRLLHSVQTPIQWAQTPVSTEANRPGREADCSLLWCLELYLHSVLLYFRKTSLCSFFVVNPYKLSRLRAEFTELSAPCSELRRVNACQSATPGSEDKKLQQPGALHYRQFVLQRQRDGHFRATNLNCDMLFRKATSPRS